MNSIQQQRATAQNSSLPIRPKSSGLAGKEPSQSDTASANDTNDTYEPRRANFMETASVVGVGVGAAITTAKVVGLIAAASNPVTAGLMAVGSVASLAAGYMLADAASAPFHWFIDNYPDGNTPVIGKVADSFQGHHKDCHDLEKMDVVANMAQTTPLSTIPMLAVAALNPGVALGSAAVGFFGGITTVQASHRLTHMRKTPGWVKAIQGSLTQSRHDHNDHHRQPHAGNYAIVNGLTNPIFDKTHVFRKLEKLIYDKTGKEPHTWLDPNLRAFAMGEISQEEYENVKNRNAGRSVYREKIQHVFEAIEARDARETGVSG